MNVSMRCIALKIALSLSCKELPTHLMDTDVISIFFLTNMPEYGSPSFTIASLSIHNWTKCKYRKEVLYASLESNNFLGTSWICKSFNSQFNRISSEGTFKWKQWCEMKWNIKRKWFRNDSKESSPTHPPILTRSHYPTSRGLTPEVIKSCHKIKRKYSECEPKRMEK